MGQFGNQPDFATNNVRAIAPSDTINFANNLGGSLIYIGDNTTTGTDMKVIVAGTVGPSVINGFSSPGYTGSGGTGYTAANNVATTTNGAGVNLTVNTTVVDNAVISIVIGNNAGTGYLNGDLITVTGGGANAVFRVEATAGAPTSAQGVVFKGLQTGGFLPVTVDYVLATGTTVEQLVAAQ